MCLAVQLDIETNDNYYCEGSAGAYDYVYSEKYKFPEKKKTEGIFQPAGFVNASSG